MKTPSHDVQAICVLGMHRSGTSLITRLLNLSGLNLGQDDHICNAGFEGNQKGHWEHQDVVTLHDLALKQQGLRWDTYVPIDTQWFKSQSANHVSRDIQIILSHELRRENCWLWKDPRTTLFLPLWKAAISELDISARYVVMVRNPLDVAKSLAKRDHIPVAIGMRIWLNYMLSALASIDRHHTCFVHYNQLVDNPHQEILRIYQELDLQSGKIHARLPDELNLFTDRSLQHSRYTLRNLERENPDSLIIDIYKTLLSLSKSGSKCSQALQKRAQYLLSAMRPPLRELHSTALELTKTQLQLNNIRILLIQERERNRTLLNSHSWKITAPLRKISQIISNPSKER